MEKKIDLKKLFVEKRYSELIHFVDNELDENKKNSSIINLVAVSRLLRITRTKEDFILAIKDFKKIFYDEKRDENTIQAFRNFIKASVDLYDFEHSLLNHKNTTEYFKEALDHFNKNLNQFSENEFIILEIIRVYKRLNDIKNVKFYYGELLKKKYFRTTSICSYIYQNCFFNDWSQEKFLEYGKILDVNLPKYNQEKLIPLSDFKNTKKIKIGFFSADIKNVHSVTYFLKSVIKNYNKDNFEIYLYFNHKKRLEDETTSYFMKKVDKFHYITHLSDEESINLIRKDNIDIFVDLMGVTSNSRLSLIKNRVARNQLLWCGYCNTTGIKEMDYILADPNLILNSEINMYTEKVIFLPKIWNCHSGLDIDRSMYDPPYKKNHYITFGSFNNFSKINDDVIETWSKILKSIKNSKLILKPSSIRVTELLEKKFKEHGVLNSIEFINPKKNFEDHMNLYQEIDLALDTFPYNGVTTSFEAIWMGVPVLTLKGYNFNSRCGESINRNLDLDYMIAKSVDDYVFKARELASNKNYLLDIRKKLFNNVITSPLFDTNNFQQDFFKILEKINNNNF